MTPRSIRSFVVTAALIWLAAAPVTSHVDAAAPVEPDVAAYAASAGVSTLEAEYQLGLQATIGKLSETLRQEKRETFGGLYVEHWPT